jgi:hypothetical protein
MMLHPAAPIDSLQTTEQSAAKRNHGFRRVHPALFSLPKSMRSSASPPLGALENHPAHRRGGLTSLWEISSPAVGGSRRTAR